MCMGRMTSEGGTRWTSHFHMPTLLAVDIICVVPRVRGLAHILLAHITCLSSSFTADRTHVLFDRLLLPTSLLPTPDSLPLL